MTITVHFIIFKNILWDIKQSVNFENLLRFLFNFLFFEMKEDN